MAVTMTKDDANNVREYVALMEKQVKSKKRRLQQATFFRDAAVRRKNDEVVAEWNKYIAGF